MIIFQAEELLLKMKNILIVDDSKAVRQVLRREISHHDFLINESPSGEDALSLIPLFKPDLITLDIEMEGLNGFETCSRLRQMPPFNSIAVIFLTAHDSIEERFKGFESGATEFYNKKFKDGTLLQAILDILYPEKRHDRSTVLVADDNRSVQMLVEHCLKSFTSNIIIANNGREAYELFSKERSKINCIITDFEMPKMRGDELCRLIRKENNFRDLPVIFLSGMANKDEILNIYRAGGSDYIVKPFIREEFIARVKVHLQAQQNKVNLEEQVIDLRQTILSRKHLTKEYSQNFEKSLSGLLQSCSSLINESVKDEILQEKLRIIHDNGNKLLQQIREDIKFIE